jgi:hypothetical protein
MYVKLNRDVCGHHIATCERCLGKFLRNPMGYERQCFEEFIESDEDILTLDIVSGDNHYRLVLNAEQREMLAGEGWAKVLEEAKIL